MAATRGPKPTKIDWTEFDKLCTYQCTQLDIADFFGVDVTTLENCCKRDLGITLSQLWDQKKRVGRTKLRKKQWDIAMGGNTAMAIFLGKQVLGQADQPMDQAIIEAIQRAGLTRESAVELILNQKKNGDDGTKKSFEEFCTTAGYPSPYPKQVEMAEFSLEETDPRLLLGSRGYGKTDYAIICAVGYDIYCHPNESTNLILSKSRERNSAMIAEIGNALTLNGVDVVKMNSTCLRVAGLHGKDHSVSTVTIKAKTLRGRHPKRVLMDDPVTEDDISEATRLHVERVYNEIIKLCKNIIIVGQPAHKHDLYAKLRPLLKKLEVPHGSIPQLDADLEAQRLSGCSEASIQASYFLKIMDEGTTPFDKVRYIDAFPIGESSVAFIDPSHEGGDYTALSIVRSWMDGVAVVGFAYKKAWNHCLEEMCEKLIKYNVKKLCFETNALGDMPIELLRNALSSTGIGVVGKKSNSNKHARIMSAGTYAPLIHLAKDSDKIYIKHVVEYEYKAKFDDAPDSLASCLEWIGLIRGVR